MAENFVAPQLEALQSSAMFQQDCAPPQWSVTVCDISKEISPKRWIGHDGPILWPPRSPDVIPLDFFVWGYMKDLIYNTHCISSSLDKECS